MDRFGGCGEFRRLRLYCAVMIQAALLSLLLNEASVRSVHDAIDTGKATCVQVVRHYLDRIDAYDDRGPSLNAIITVNAKALETAAQMDRLDRAARARLPLHCIPV